VCGGGGKGPARPPGLQGANAGALTGKDPEPAARELLRLARLGLRDALAQSIDFDFALGKNAGAAKDALIDDLFGLLAPDRACALAFERKTSPDGIELAAYCPMSTAGSMDPDAGNGAEVRTDHFTLTMFRDKSGAWKARRWASTFHGVYDPGEAPER
jgi:hypothetical protein